MGFTDVLRKAWPFISTAASLGGPLGTMAAGAVGKAIGADVKPSYLTTTLQNLATTEQGRIQLDAAEKEYSETMTKLGFQDAETMEQIAAGDRASARQREVQVKDYTPEIGFYLLLFVFTYMVHYLFKYALPPENRAIVYTMAGSIGTLLITAATYFYGTTRGSETKTVALQNLASTAVQATSAAVKK